MWSRVPLPRLNPACSICSSGIRKEYIQSSLYDPQEHLACMQNQSDRSVIPTFLLNSFLVDWHVGPIPISYSLSAIPSSFIYSYINPS